MHLAPRETEKLLIVVAADLARRRQARGVKLNYPESVAIITYEILEGVRDGWSVAELISQGASILQRSGATQRREVANTGNRPIPVGSHSHFYETNTAQRFDREAVRGFRRNVPAGTAVRFAPGDTREVELAAPGGEREVFGSQAEVNGPLLS